MGWASGTDLVVSVATAIRDNVPDSRVRRKLYKALVDAAQDCDWDCLDEAADIDPILDRILNLNDKP